MSDRYTFYNMLKNNAEKSPDSIAVIYDTIEVSYKKLFEDVIKKALHLRKFTGDRIAIYGPASYRLIVNIFGTILAGKDLVLIDFFLPHDAREALLKKTDVDYTLTSTNQYILSDVHANIIRDAEKDDVEGLTFTAGKEGNVFMFTATSEESDKPVVLTTDNILNTAYQISKRVYCSSEDKLLSQISLHHVFGFIYSLIWPLNQGACVCIGRGLRHMDADTYYYCPTILPGTPSMFDYLRRVKGFNRELKTVVIGAAGCPFRLFENLNDIDLDVYTVYGMTEASGCIGVNDLMDGSFTLFDDDSIMISNDGEILVRGRAVMEGYYNDDKTNESVIVDGVYHTGDYGRINSSGRLVITKRNPDIILLPTGEKISRKRTIDEISALSGVAESFITVYNNKLIAIIVPLNKDDKEEKFKKKIDKYNELKGYRWEIQQIVLSKEPLAKLPDGSIDEDKIQDLLEL